MANSKAVVIALAIMTTTAVAQPGATPPTEPAPAPAPAPSPPVSGPTEAGPGQAPISEPAAVEVSESALDQLVAKAYAEAPTVLRVAKGAFRRARRAISFGPTVGLWTTAIVDPGDIDAALSFGLGFELFKVPVLPDSEDLKEMVIESVKSQLKDRIHDVFKGRQPQPSDLEQLVKQVYTDVRNEILGLENTRSKTMERPAMSLGVEANRLFGAERWLGRIRGGVGIWKFTLAASLSVGRVCRSATCDDRVKLFAGPEIVLHFLTSKNPRASVVDGFVRGDFQTIGRGMETYDQVVLGARFLLDVI